MTEVKLVFDSMLWGGQDQGDNSQFWKPADILSVRSRRNGERVATVRFHHDGRISHGHFVDCMEPITAASKEEQ